jgi:cytochrome b subunit of formate dehydrogenase
MGVIIRSVHMGDVVAELMAHVSGVKLVNGKFEPVYDLIQLADNMQ